MSHDQFCSVQFPSPVDAAIKLLDSSARKLLICNATILRPCGLTGISGGRDWGEEWLGESEMRPEAAKMADGRSPQVSARVRANTRHL
jgi:hypothetical protein